MVYVGKSCFNIRAAQGTTTVLARCIAAKAKVVAVGWHEITGRLAGSSRRVQAWGGCR